MRASGVDAVRVDHSARSNEPPREQFSSPTSAERCPGLGGYEGSSSSPDEGVVDMLLDLDLTGSHSWLDSPLPST